MSREKDLSDTVESMAGQNGVGSTNKFIRLPQEPGVERSRIVGFSIPVLS
eukprot:GAFH01001552.1.p6 GENE.GAFH01001552.1~~GAFH01001552.1.p6  ORF type:complete len:50 (-),score=4.81 GAFH01001552.1:214-363(-)